MSKKSETKPDQPQTLNALAARDLFDALTLNAERVEVLAGHLAKRLEKLDQEQQCDELYALSLIAESIRDKQIEMREKARTLFGGVQ